MKLISTTSLSKLKEVTGKVMFTLLSEAGLIIKDSEDWVLTDRGIELGGEYKESTKFGKYIVWPENLEIESHSSVIDQPKDNPKLITSTVIGKHFELSANKINFVLSELGWLEKGLKGWLVTEQGEKQQGGTQKENHTSGVPFAIWPESILNSKSLKETISSLKGTDPKEKPIIENIKKASVDFREKFEANFRATDGHFVRSKAEMLVDNWLYMAGIVHAYERKLPIEEDVYCDFYIPTGNVYIEYWGYENDSKYLNRKKQKQDIYLKYGFKLIELQDSDVQNLDDILPKMLLKHGVKAY